MRFSTPGYARWLASRLSRLELNRNTQIGGNMLDIERLENDLRFGLDFDRWWKRQRRIQLLKSAGVYVSFGILLLLVARLILSM